MSWRILNRRTRFDIIRGILLVGLASAIAVYVTARDPGTDPLGNPLDQSKVYLRTVEMVGGTANVVASQITDGFTALQLAAFFGQPASVEALLLCAPDVNAVSRNPMKVAVINAAAASRNLEVVKLVLQAGANPDAQQHAGYTAMHEAAANNNVELAKALLNAGADPGVRTDAGLTAADMAREKGHTEIAELLEARKPPAG